MGLYQLVFFTSLYFIVKLLRFYMRELYVDAVALNIDGNKRCIKRKCVLLQLF